MEKSRLLQMHNVGIVVESLDNVISFFTEIGLKLEGRAMVEIAMMVTPEGHSRLELSRFIRPATVSDHKTSPVNSLGYRRVMFRVENLDELVARLKTQGAQVWAKWCTVQRESW